MAGADDGIMKGRDRFVSVSLLGCLIISVWLLVVAGGLLLLGGDWPGLGLLGLGGLLVVAYRTPSFEASMANFAVLTGYVVCVFLADTVLMVILGYIALDNLDDPGPSPRRSWLPSTRRIGDRQRAGAQG